MRTKIFYTLCFVVLVFACKNETKEQPKTPSSTIATAPRTAAEIQNIYLKNCNEILFAVPDYDTGPFYYADRAKSQGVLGPYPAGGIERYLQKLTGPTYTMKDAHDNMIKLPNSRVREVFTTCYVY